MLHQLQGFQLAKKCFPAPEAVPGSDKVDSKMSLLLTDGSLVVVVILDVQVPAGDRERRVILVELCSAPVV